MLFIELEDLIINILIKLYNYRALRRVTGVKIKDCINIISENLSRENKILKISDRRDCMKNSCYFDVLYSGNFDAEYILKDHITISDLNMHNFVVPNEIVSIFESDYFLHSLGISTFKHTSIDELLVQVLQDTTAFYFQIGGKLGVEEYYYIKSMLQNKKCENCIKISCEQRHSTLVCDDWDNRELIGRCKILRDYNVLNLKK